MFARTVITLSLLSLAAMGCSSEEPSEASDASTNISEGDEQTVAGGYAKASVDDKKITATAEFAVTEESRKGTKINLKSISSAETQVVAGTNYKLVLVVEIEGTEKTVEAIVYEDLQQARTLSSWTTM